MAKEADALHAAGHHVHVVAGWYFPPIDRFDEEIYSRAEWDRTLVYYMTGPRVLLAKVRHRLARNAIARTENLTLRHASRACHPATSLLARAAARVKADLYIGHTVAGLAAAAAAARRTNAAFAFDAEDFHPDETETSQNDPAVSRPIRTVESTLMPACVHVTAASPLIAAAYSERYGIKCPVTVLNTFPLSSAPKEPVAISTEADRPVRLYWFSQTIGRGRGLEEVIAVLSAMKTPTELHLRGLPASGVVEMFRIHARNTGHRGSITVHPLDSPTEMVRLAAEYDLGLSLEQTKPPNRDICLTNKIFTYLLAGVPVGLTPTRAQRALATDLGPAALLLDLNAPRETAAALDSYFASPERRAAARTAAWRLGQTRYNWEVEQANLLAAIGATTQPVSSHA